MDTVLSIDNVISIVEATVGCVLGFVAGIGILFAYQVYTLWCLPLLITGVAMIAISSIISTILTCFLLAMRGKRS